ncbi:porin [Rhodohalobacter sp. 8-1]|uniref:porin n=1 Tax=Rhodohalobacter sp. 8-1 TaxID=3131972 RepID=UPI0030ECA23C
MKHTIKSTLFIIALLITSPVNAQISLDVGGYLQTWYIADQQIELASGETANTNGFRLRRARITARGDISERFSTTIWTDLAGSDNILFDFYADAKLHPAFNIRVGQFIMPGQSYDTARLVSSKLIFWERPGISTALSSGMGYDAFRDIGVMVYGRHKSLWYGVHAGNGTGRFSQAETHITERKPGGGLYGARLDLEITPGLTLGGHLSTNQQRDIVERGTGPVDINRTSASVRVATSNLGIDRLYTQFEYMGLQVKDESHGIQTGLDGSYNLDGFYAEIGYGITNEWHILGRFDRMNQSPGQGAGFPADESFHREQITLGLSRYLCRDDREIARAHLNYATGNSSPGNLDSHAIVIVMQLRFIPL